MNLLAEILTYITQTLGSLFLLTIILRFFLQLARADFYNPLSQGIVKITNPFLIPLRRVIPGVFGIDIASIILALAVQFIVGEFNYFVVNYSIYNPLFTLIFGILGTIKISIYLFMAVGFVMVISSFIAPFSSHPILLLCRQLIEPATRPIQKVIPPMGGLDFSILFVFMGLQILLMVVDSAAGAVFEQAAQNGLSIQNLGLLTIGY